MLDKNITIDKIHRRKLEIMKSVLKRFGSKITEFGFTELKVSISF